MNFIQAAILTQVVIEHVIVPDRKLVPIVALLAVLVT